MSLISFVSGVRGKAIAHSAKLATSQTSSFWSTTTVLQPTARAVEGVVPKALHISDLVKVVSEAHDLSQAESGRIINTVLDTIIESVAGGKTASLKRFGVFETYTGKARIARNPRTGEAVNIPAKARLRFRPYLDLKMAITGEPPKKIVVEKAKKIADKPKKIADKAKA